MTPKLKPTPHHRGTGAVLPGPSCSPSALAHNPPLSAAHLSSGIHYKSQRHFPKDIKMWDQPATHLQHWELSVGVGRTGVDLEAKPEEADINSRRLPSSEVPARIPARLPRTSQTQRQSLTLLSDGEIPHSLGLIARAHLIVS